MENLTDRQPVDRDALDDLMRRTMQAGEATGWHNGDDVGAGYAAYLVYDTFDVVTTSEVEGTMRRVGTPIRGSRYAAQPVLGPDMFSLEHAISTGIDSPAGSIYNFAMNVGFADLELADQQLTRPGALKAFRHFLRKPGVLGFMAIGEGWGFQHPSPVVAALMKSGMRPGNIEGAAEVRRVFFSDIHGQVSRAYKWRDEPDIEIEHDTRRCDHLVLSVRILADVAAGGPLPDSEEAFQARYHGSCNQHSDED